MKYQNLPAKMHVAIILTTLVALAAVVAECIVGAKAQSAESGKTDFDWQACSPACWAALRPVDARFSEVEVNLDPEQIFQAIGREGAADQADLYN